MFSLSKLFNKVLGSIDGPPINYHMLRTTRYRLQEATLADLFKLSQTKEGYLSERKHIFEIFFGIFLPRPKADIIRSNYYG